MHFFYKQLTPLLHLGVPIAYLCQIKNCIMKEQIWILYFETTKNYTCDEKDLIDHDFLFGLILKNMYNNHFDEDNFFNEQLNSILKNLPKKIDNVRLVLNKKTEKDISNLKKYVKNKYNLIPIHFYVKKWLEIGRYIGFFLTIIASNRLFKVTIDTYIISTFLNIVVSFIGYLLVSTIGLPVGKVIGFIIGYLMDKWAERQKRVIQN